MYLPHLLSEREYRKYVQNKEDYENFKNKVNELMESDMDDVVTTFTQIREIIHKMQRLKIEIDRHELWYGTEYF